VYWIKTFDSNGFHCTSGLVLKNNTKIEKKRSTLLNEIAQVHSYMMHNLETMNGLKVFRILRERER
jgi:hypothetical protein